MPTIIYIVEKRGMAVVEIESNLCSVIEYNPTDELNIGDPVTGDFKTEGSTLIFNENSYNEMAVTVQNACIGENIAKERAFLFKK